jgi:lipoprotein-anchoring transpeptidase ErfK/SrfK
MMARKKRDPSLGKIIAVLLALLVVAYGVYRGAGWFNDTYVSGTVEAAAPNHIDEAKTLIAEGKAAEARKLLEPIAARVDDGTLTPQALMLLARLDRDAGDMNRALERLQRAVEAYPASPLQPVAAVQYARLLEDNGKFSEAFQVYEKVRASAPPELRAPALTGIGRHAERQERLAEARGLYREAALSAKWDSSDWTEAVHALGKANTALIFSRQATPESQVYTVVSGDTLTSIGIKLNTTQGLLTRANGLTEDSTLRIGQQLKYTPKDFHIVIERTTNRLFLFDSDGLFKMYPAGLGKPGYETTLGSYKIGNKQKDPVWFKPGFGAVPAGDPENELGTRWMPLVPEKEDLPTDLGIHGTIAPETIGQKMSRGCPRMFPEDVEELYDLVVRATPVEIVETLPEEYRTPHRQIRASAQLS